VNKSKNNVTSKQKEVSCLAIVYLVANILTIAVIDSFYGVLTLSTHVTAESKPSQLGWQINACFLAGFSMALIETFFSVFASISEFIQSESFENQEDNGPFKQFLVGMRWV
jgi:hypothetical protein